MKKVATAATASGMSASRNRYVIEEDIAATILSSTCGGIFARPASVKSERVSSVLKGMPPIPPPMSANCSFRFERKVRL
ncbi:hypothetical protein D3C73_1590270 [compost metagenome]